ncbi:MAG: CopG family transcriptional regulator [Ignavibacteria bacterium]|nr:CopG family transcriptional regulator [Ignavibacteria bacterium]
MKAKTFDKQFDDGEDVLAHLDLSSATRPEAEARRVNVDFPSWIVRCLDTESQRIGVTRQALIKFWIVERIEQEYRVSKGKTTPEQP